MPVETAAFFIVFTLGFGITLALIPVMDHLGRRLGIVARVGGRRRSDADRRQVSKLGGVALFAGFTAAVLAAQALNVPRFDSAEVIRLMGLIAGGTLIFCVGVLDDIFEFGPVKLGAAQIIAAGIAVGGQIIIERFNNPFTGSQTDPWPYAVTVVISMFWLVLMMNTVNFMDGLDGLAAGVAFIAGVMLFVHSAFVLEPAQTSVSLLPLALMGSTLAFVLFNFHPAGIIMGGGAMFLGYAVGTLSIIGGAKMATVLLVMGLPLMDLAWQVVNRLRQGRNPMHGDRGHIHFRLLDIGFTQRQIVVTYYLFCTFFGVLTLVTASRIFKFMAFGALVLLLVACFLWLMQLNQAGSSKSS
jgi:UDP-GlcNAc:undecaprenyl-phosphate GlcNAc-1-phosphate transferase